MSCRDWQRYTGSHNAMYCGYKAKVEGGQSCILCSRHRNTAHCLFSKGTFTVGWFEFTNKPFGYCEDAPMFPFAFWKAADF